MLEPILLSKAELDHLGSYPLADKTVQQITEMDDRFFATLNRLKFIQASLIRDQLPLSIRPEKNNVDGFW